VQGVGREDFTSYALRVAHFLALGTAFTVVRQHLTSGWRLCAQSRMMREEAQ
jgi:hypothetical protein